MLSSGCLGAGPGANGRGLRGHRRWFWTLRQPLFQQQGRRGTVEGATAIAMEAMAFGSGPATGEFIHQRKRQCEMAGQPFAVAAAVLGLLRGLLLGIERQANHQGGDVPLGHHVAQVLEVGWIAASPDGGEGGHGEPQGITTSQPDAFAAHIQGQHGARCRACQGLPRGVGIGRCPG